MGSNIRKHDRALKNHKIKLRDVGTKLIQALSSKQKAIDLLKRVKTARNMHREKAIAAKEKLKVVKKKNVALSKMLSAEKTKSADINHRAWRDKKENLTLLTETTKSHHTLLTETTKSHQAELEKQQDDTKEKLRNERRRFNEELKKRQAGLKKKQDDTEENLRNECR